MLLTGILALVYVWRVGNSPRAFFDHRLEVDGCRVSLAEAFMMLGVVASRFFLRNSSAVGGKGTGLRNNRGRIVDNLRSAQKQVGHDSIVPGTLKTCPTVKYATVIDSPKRGYL